MHGERRHESCVLLRPKPQPGGAMRLPRHLDARVRRQRQGRRRRRRRHVPERRRMAARGRRDARAAARLIGTERAQMCLFNEQDGQRATAAASAVLAHPAAAVAATAARCSHRRGVGARQASRQDHRANPELCHPTHRPGAFECIEAQANARRTVQRTDQHGPTAVLPLPAAEAAAQHDARVGASGGTRQHLNFACKPNQSPVAVAGQVARFVRCKPAVS
eukprot:scaffold69026_cov78-Phaeocystis_antarctica.AAC.2